jgi:uncharacterized caspase-like protein
MRRAVLALLVVFASCIGALAERRVALVIGNGAYTDMDTLPNPANDANAIAALLENQLRFTVVKAVDADHRAMGEVLARFASIAQDAEIAIVFYAGHGIQANGRNYLLPVSARLANQTDLITQGVRLDDIIEIMDASGARAKLLFIDACRNNPLPGGLARGASRMGLAKLEVGVIGTLIAFATAPDQIALDGSGSNSPFTSALLAYLGAPGLEIRQALWRVRSSVYQSTERRQLPWVNDALMAELFLAGRRLRLRPRSRCSMPTSPSVRPWATIPAN